ncbi:MAG: GIY-YIG nuclease family protein [Candidatus Taylorbacteria bacterium]
MIRQYVNKLNLPREPGVYIFRDYKEKPIYIGRATSLKDRVKSYFSIDLIKTRGPRIIDMVTRSKSLSFEETDSVLEAIILESSLIKKYQPKYNVDEKDDKSSEYVVITDELWPRVFLSRSRDIDQSIKAGTLPYKIDKLFGPYPYGGVIKDALQILRKLFPFKDEKSLDPRHDRFYRSIGRSPSIGEQTLDEANKQYHKTIKYLILFFQGKKKTIRNKVMKDMIRQANTMHFEDAQRSKKLLYALDHIDDMALIKNEDNGDTSHSVGSFRIEAYDVAHLSGTNVVGAMVVMINGKNMSSEYRKFNLSRQVNNDASSLAEILLRRFNHTEWTYPDLIIVDGNHIQKNVAESVLKSRRLDIPVVAVTKNAAHKAENLLGDGVTIDRYRREIIKINTEAHRYTIKHHRNVRSKVFKPVIQ